MFGDCLSLAPLPESAVPNCRRRLVVIGLVWFAGLALVTTAQLELDSIDPGALTASSLQAMGTNPKPAV
jgi:hypothetical protein